MLLATHAFFIVIIFILYRQYIDSTKLDPQRLLREGGKIFRPGQRELYRTTSAQQELE
jgi:hypothetical protein